MHRSTAKRSLENNHGELDAKLELLQQLCLQDAGDAQAPDNPHLRSRISYVDQRWLQAEYGWTMESAATSTVSFLDEEEDMDACMPHLYDPTLFSDPRVTPTLPTKPTTKSHQRAYSEKDKVSLLAVGIERRCSQGRPLVGSDSGTLLREWPALDLEVV
ncbi:uncharacterized protein B0H18DRAFT_1012493 [Fomitopsis serialis]|uniref:uncharacterized protein n=1 Tax=Fomitopsis serialis TaxID=139415 RepID=UPI0020079151|nr:uncharacterized protein B0H18DRAFT_1012493 [Neoantrodia serialis]KAH9924143.1 hypothetical protein B0H18DRAFT_1012493 [Neoantrodia serialis]